MARVTGTEGVIAIYGGGVVTRGYLFIDYSTSQTDTQYNITTVAGVVLTQKGQGGASFSMSGARTEEKIGVSFGAGTITTYTIFTSKTTTITKTKSTQTIKINENITRASGTTGTAPSSAVLTVSVPAKPSYAIRYDANGGADAPADQTKWYGEDITLQSGIPTRSGYRFLGWATSQGGAVAYQPSAAYTVNSPLTLYAVWEAYYTYTINTMRVNASGDIIEDPNGEWIYIKANLTTEDYTNNPLTAYHFKDNGAAATVGWYKNSDKTDSVTFPYQPASNSFILYAWYHADTEKHEVSFQFDTNHTTGKVISVIVPPIFRTMDFLAGGKGIAIGKPATEANLFECELDAMFNNSLKKINVDGTEIDYEISDATIAKYVDLGMSTT